MSNPSYDLIYRIVLITGRLHIGPFVNEINSSEEEVQFNVEINSLG